MTLIEHMNWIELVFILVAAGYLVSGIDDIAFDVIYWLRRVFKGKAADPVHLSELLQVEEKRAAILIPAWSEADIIEEMLLYNDRIIRYENYDVFVGTYPNDEATRTRVYAAARRLPNVIRCTGKRPGPTTKADNLNAMLHELERHEEATGTRYDFIVLHDPEDVLHPYELKLMNYHMSRGTGDMVQFPILPLPSPRSRFTQATYMDQFAENQTKDMLVRAWAGGFVPSSGVATAISRTAIEALRRAGRGEVFTETSVTEDYEIGLRLRLEGLLTTFVRPRLILDVTPEDPSDPATVPVDEWVATRSEFPYAFSRAVRQRARWSLGIVFQSWKRSGWKGGLVDRWLLFHDRKGAWTYPLLAIGYVYFLVIGARTLLRYLVDPDLPFLLDLNTWTIWLVFAVTVLMFNRLLQRAVAVFRIYGPAHAVLSVARQPWDNIVSMTAMARAGYQFARYELRGRQVAWDKTHHEAPPPVVNEMLSERAVEEAPVRNGYDSRVVYKRPSEITGDVPRARLGR